MTTTIPPEEKLISQSYFVHCLIAERKNMMLTTRAQLSEPFSPQFFSLKKSLFLSFHFTTTYLLTQDPKFPKKCTMIYLIEAKT
jgi:hypothetical protein